MRYRLDDIASDYKFDYQDFAKFATEAFKPNLYCLIEIGGVLTTSSWFSDKLIDDYKQHLKNEKSKR